MKRTSTSGRAGRLPGSASQKPVERASAAAAVEEVTVSIGEVAEHARSTRDVAANAGEVCVIVAQARDLNRSGHISVVVPEQGADQARRSADGEVLRPLESQAGTRNLARGVSARAWWAGSRFQSFAFWRHP